MEESTTPKKVNWGHFLFDILICSLGAFGGPEAHYGVFTHQMVTKKKYLTEEELVELMALCSFLPGPSSTQTIVAIGHKAGGPVLALLTMLVWAVPAVIVMTTLSFLYQILAANNIDLSVLRYIGPMAVAFILLASYKLGKKVIGDTMTLFLFIFGAVVTYFIRDPWIFPTVLLIGGIVSVIVNKEENMWNRVKLNPPYPYLALFLVFTFGSLILAALFSNPLIQLFERFYRYGYLVFGGGQVVIPVMLSELVDVTQSMTTEQFLTGYGLVQGNPGPMFSFSAYAGGMAMNDGSTMMQIAGALTGALGIFLPGLLLIYFVYPIWENLKKIRAIQIGLKGIAAVAGGLIIVAAVILTQESGFTWDNLLVTAIVLIALITKKIPAPFLVLFAILLGFIF
jgi:chromate transporter